jgi:hypothetical protein
MFNTIFNLNIYIMTSKNPVHHPFIIPPAIKAPLPGGAQTAGEAALHLQQQQLATQLAGGAAISPASIMPPEGTEISVPQVGSPAINVNPFMNAHTAAKAGAVNFLNNHAQSEYDYLAGQDQDATQSGGSLMKVLNEVHQDGQTGRHTSCYLSGGKKKRTKRNPSKGLKKHKNKTRNKKGKQKIKTRRVNKSRKRRLSHKKK